MCYNGLKKCAILAKEKGWWDIKIKRLGLKIKAGCDPTAHYAYFKFSLLTVAVLRFQVQKMVDEIERLKTDSNDKLNRMNADLEAKDAQLSSLTVERRRHLEEAYEMK